MSIVAKHPSPHCRHILFVGLIGALSVPGWIVLPSRCAATSELPEAEVAKAFNVGPAAALVASDSVLWVAAIKDGGMGGRAGYVLAAVDTANGSPVTTVDLGYLNEIVDIAIGFGSLWLASDPGKVIRVDPKRAEITAQIKVGRGVGAFVARRPALAIGEGALWVVTGGVVQRVDPATGEVTSVPVDKSLGPPESVAAGEGAVWVVQRKGVSRLDPDKGALTASIPLELRRKGREIVVTATAVWVADGVDEGIYCIMTPEKSAGTVYRIDPATNRVVVSARLPCGAHLIEGPRARPDPLIAYEVYFGRKDHEEEWITALDPSTATGGRPTQIYSGKTKGRWRYVTGPDGVWVFDGYGLRKISLTQ